LWLPLFFGTAALWYAPFGWIAWGPRLEVPVIGAWVYAVLITLPPGVTARLSQLATRPRALFAAGFITIAFGLVPSASPWSSWPALMKLMEADNSCPSMTQVPIQENEHRYYRCIVHYAWRRPGSVIKRSAEAPTAVAFGGQVALILSALALLADGRRDAEVSAMGRAQPRTGPVSSRPIHPRANVSGP